MRRGLVAAFVLAAALLIDPSAAAAGERIDRAGQALTVAPLYVEPEVASLLTPEAQSAIAGRLADSRTPIYVAVLTDAALAEAGGDPTRLTAELQRAAGDRSGTYAVLIGDSFAAGSTVIGRTAAAIADAIAARQPDPAQRVLDFADEVERAATLPASGAADHGSPRARSSGVPTTTTWLIIAICAVLAVLAAAVRGRRRHRDLDDLTAIQSTIAEDIGSYGAALRKLDAQVRVSARDRTATADFGRAHGAHERAKQAALRVRTVPDARAVTAALEEGWYALACAGAHRNGQEAPPRRPPCLFDPRHGPAAVDVAWSPDGSEVRPVPACHADAERVAAGRDPQVRMVRYADGNRPYWETGPAYAPWAEGWYDAHNALVLATLLWGTPLGDVWDDPAIATVESPFDGWSETS